MWMLDGGSKRHASTERESHDRCGLEPEAPDQVRDVVGHRFEAHRSVDGG
jgi:hypothetical protein